MPDPIDDGPTDEATPPRRLRRGLLIGGAVIVTVVLLLGGTILVLRARDSTTEVSVDDALGSFRAAGASASPEQRRPVPGVYVYETVGEERIDALGGGSHTYPVETTMSYTLTECGYQVRWDVFEERFDELDLCITGGGESVDTTRQYREFFGISNDLTFQCDAAALVRVEPTELGVMRSTPCTAAGSTAEIRVTVIGAEPIDVGGVPVDSLHVVLETTLSGDVRATSTLNYWVDPVTGLIFRRESAVTSKADSPLGVTTYEENYTVQLVSLDPRR